MNFSKPVEQSTHRDNSDLVDLAKGMQKPEIAAGIPVQQGLARAATAALAIGLSAGALGIVYAWPKSVVGWGAAIVLLTFGYYLNRYVGQGIDVWVHDFGRVLDLLEKRVENETKDRPVSAPAPINQYNVPRSNGGISFYRTRTRHEKMQIFAAGIVMGRSISEKEWTSGPSRLFTQGEWRVMIAEMIDRGILEWIDPENHQQGSKPTDDGWNFFEGLAAPLQPTSPPLPENGNGRA